MQDITPVFGKFTVRSLMQLQQYGRIQVRVLDGQCRVFNVAPGYYLEVA